MLKKLGLTNENTILTIEKHGNTSAASVPLALNEGIISGKIKKNDLILLEALGGGFTWGALLLRY
jgi:3-oxoacyl-[acyl-carrier-protein] synthase-3